MKNDTPFEMATSNIRSDLEVTAEVSMDLEDRGVRHDLVVTDKHLAELQPVVCVRDLLEREGVSYAVFHNVREEPTDVSMKAASRLPQQSALYAYSRYLVDQIAG